MSIGSQGSIRGALLLALACIHLSALGCTSEKPAANTAAPGAKRLILITNGDSPFWKACRAGVDAAQKELKLDEQKFKAVMEVNDGTLARQIDQLRQFGSQSDVAGIGISVIDARNASLANELKKLKEKGIAVITFDSDVDREKFRDARTAFIGTDNFKGGKELGKCAKELRPDGGDYVAFVGTTSAQNANDRIEGFQAGAGDKFKRLDFMPDDFDQGRAQENVRNALRNHPDVNVLVGIYSYNAPAIADIVQETMKRDAVKVVTFDAEKGAIKRMGDGLIDAMVVQNPYQMGFQGIRLLRALSQKDDATVKEMLPRLGETDGDIYDTGLKVVIPDEGSPIKGEDFGKKTEFLKLGEFQEWLKKYDLTDS